MIPGAEVRPLVPLLAAGSLVAVAVIGLWSVRRTRDARDYFIAGQRLGLFVTGLATMSAAFSGFVFLGGPGLTGRIGAAALLIVAPVGFTSTLLCWTVAPRLRELAGGGAVLTIPDALRARFGSRAVGGLAAATIVLGTAGYLGAQLTALGIVFEELFGLGAGGGLPFGMLLGIGFLLAYSVAGGMVAGAYTDVLQGLLMLAAAVGVFVWLPAAVGSPAGLLADVAGSPRLAPGFADPLRSAPALTGLGFLFLFGIGPLGQPHMLHKFFMLRDAARLRWLPLVLGASQSLCLLIWVGIGFAVPALVARGAMVPPDRPDAATPQLLLGHAPDVLAGVVFAAVLAAIMSTADSLMNVGSAALVRDLPLAFGRTVRRQLPAARLATVAITLAAGLLAWLYDDLIALLGTFAFGTFAAGLAPALVIGLAWPRAGARAAGASIVCGAGLNLLLELSRREPLASLLPFAPIDPGAIPAAIALAASFTVMIVVSWLSPSRAARNPHPDS